MRAGARSGLPRDSGRVQFPSERSESGMASAVLRQSGGASLYHPPAVEHRIGPPPVPKGEPRCDAPVTTGAK
ncbi:protein of unknown function [Streptomyces sp. KY75]|nr:protein of unknown function [Streptomyces sp. KY75]